MSMEQTINETVKQTWELFKKQYVTLIVATLIAMICMIFIITIPPLIYGLYMMCVDLMRGKEISFTSPFKGFNYFFRSWGLILLIGLMVFAGLLLLIIPGILLMIVLQYALAISVIENKGVIDSIKKSFNLGQNNFVFSLVLFLIVGILSAIGSALRIGGLVTMPFTSLLVCVATMKLTSNKLPKVEAKVAEKKPIKKKAKK